jgi:N12 class adenine-specific DNA methylase
MEFAQNWDFHVEPGIFFEIDKIVEKKKQMVEASNAINADFDHPEINENILPYQRAGISYLLSARRAILGDQPGLGKTLQAMSAVVVENAFPCVVVCPNTLKLNWEAEVNKFYPDKTTTVVYGKSNKKIDKADFIIINYDIVADRVDDLLALKPVSLVADESHAIKNGHAYHVCPECDTKVRVNARNCPNEKCGHRMDAPVRKWTVKRAGGVMKIAESIPEDGIISLLTGTPITNRPIELMPQLEAIRALDQFGGRWKLQDRYCPARRALRL